MPSSPDQDERMMERALALARVTAGLASPNPQVGCVLTRNGEILGEGAHLYERRDHAEIVALKQAAALGNETRGATAYVTLEPCSHHGRTGPCADALIAAGITRCVVATEDPNPQVGGQGIRKLRAAGVEVLVGVGKESAQRINDAFAWSIRHGIPMVTLKAALSVDGYLAPPPASRHAASPHWLTGPLARAEVQQMRHASDAILTGIGTVLADDPALTDRTGLPRRRPLMRIVLDPRLRIPLHSKLVQSARGDVRLFCAADATLDQPETFARLQRHGVEVVELAGGPRLNLRDVLATLAASEVRSVLLEAGPALNAAFLSAGLVHQAFLFFSQTELGAGSLPFAAGGPSPFVLQEKMQGVEHRTFGPDVGISGRLTRIWPGDAQPMHSIS